MGPVPTLDEFAAMTLQEVEARAAELPSWRRRGVVSWLLGRERGWEMPEAEQELWRRVAERMRKHGASRIADLGDDEAFDWQARLATMRHLRRS